MTQVAEAPADPRQPQVELRDALLRSGLLLDAGSDGLYLRSETFESVVLGVQSAVRRVAAGEVDLALHFPLVMVKRLLEETDYVRSFPNLLGCVNAFGGGDQDHAELLRGIDAGGSVDDFVGPTDLALAPAGCHQLYPSQRGSLPEGGRTVAILAHCFRHEPSVDPARMQVFRMQEIVYLGDPARARSHRDRWVERGLELLRGLGLTVEPEVANDPFFGRAGRMLSANQRAEELKIELVAPIASAAFPTAIASANCHQDHFGEAFDIATASGDVAHSSCVGFGLERVALALFGQLGIDASKWPSATREQLGL